MATETIQNVVLRRLPPGDRWVFANSKNSAVYSSLTDALEAWYQENNDTQFFMDARKGTVEIVTSVKVEKPTKKFSLYGEE
jgi:hypothetical protein